MSGLRCKPNELAVIVRAPSYPQFLGRIVRVTQLSRFRKPLWYTDPPLVCGDTEVLADDDCLRPIRPGTDEPATETTKEREAA